MSKPPLPRVMELFNQVVHLPIDERSAFLDAACAGDADLRAAVEELLLQDADDTNIFDASPIARQDKPTVPPAPGSAAMPSLLPQVPGYELLRTLGRGGMGVVFLARHIALNRLVALKMLAHVPLSAEKLGRFRRETEALAKLAHPNIVPIYDVGECGGHPFYTMEYIDGPSLAELLDGRPQDPMESARLVEVLAEAVEAVHQCGIIHRDLKPANVLLASGVASAPRGSPRGADATPLANYTPKITDFGLAKDQTEPGRLTPTGTAMGTPSYMAPEQVLGRSGSVGPAADIYALGSILYEMLTGRAPFDGESPIIVMAQVLHDEPLSPARLRPRLPKDLVTICLKCLEKSPRRRYASARALADDLRRFQSGKPIQARPVGAIGRAYRWCLRRPLVAGLTAIIAALLIAFIPTVIVYHFRLQDALERSQTEVRDEHQEIIELNITIGNFALNHDDAFMAVLRYSEALRLDEGNGATEHDHRARIAKALRHCPRLLRVAIHDGPVLCAHLGPSRGWVVTIRADNTVEVWDVLTNRSTGLPFQLDEVPRDAAISDDGQMLATVSPTGKVHIWDVRRRQSFALPTQEMGPMSHVAFPPGGRELLTISADTGVQLWSVSQDQAMRLWTVSGSDEKGATLSEDSHWVFKNSLSGEGQLWDTTTRKLVASLKWRQTVTRIAVSEDGRQLALATDRGSVRIWDIVKAEWLTGSMDLGPGIRHVEFSPDGGLLLVASDMAARVWNTQTGQGETPPLRLGGPLAAVTFTADGRRVVAASRRGTVSEWQLRRPDEPGDESVAERPVVEIVLLARMLACERIDDKQEPQVLEEESFRKAWTELHPAP